MRVAVDAWTNVLTDPQRESWNLYAFNTPILNRLGEPTKRSGQNMFVRSNVPRLQAGDSLVVTASPIFDLGSFTPITALAADASATTITFSFSNADDWANELGSTMYIYQSRPVNPTVDFFKGPWQLASLIAGDSMTPPTDPKTFTGLFAMVAGQKMWVKVRVSRADGRYTDSQIESCIVVA